MDGLLEQLSSDPLGRLILHHVATCGLWNCYVFLLVVARLAGVIVIAPYITNNPLPLLMRALLVVLFAFIVTPTLAGRPLLQNDVVQVSHESSSIPSLPTSILDLGSMIAIEVGLGAMLGVGLLTVFNGLKLGGEWLDRHSGLGLGSAFDPNWSSGDSASVSWVQWLGIATLLLLEPVGGHWLVLRSLVQSFDAIPLGTTAWSITDLLSGMVQQSLTLGLRIAMPVIATTWVVDLTLGLANRGSAAPLHSTCVALRLCAGLTVLALATTSIPDVIAMTTTSTLQLLTSSHAVGP